MRVLITGITGFAGSHLADFIIAEFPWIEIFGTWRWRSRLENVEHLKNAVTFIECDLKDQSSIARALAKINPARIFHLAAHSYVPTSWKMPTEVLINNIGGEANLFEAARNMLHESTRIHVACSSEEYGLVHQSECPITEDNPLRPVSPYGVSKVAQDLLAYQYHQSYGTWVVRTRAFNHTGPRRGEVFVCSDFAKQLVEIELKLREPRLKVGNLAAIRDFTDVRDVVRGYWLALEKGEPGDVYNIGGGAAYSMNDVLSLLLELTGLTTKVLIEVDKDRLRPSDVPVLICDASKFQKQTGWNPEIPFKQTMIDLLNYWRKRLRSKLQQSSNV